ncbi:hypothetical protein ERO13_D02G143333v2 [Gossypium hirsutum]|uniref:Uncharacterized protein n=2 Tax=Gossypium TaxID=3633 RepID=A0A5J5SDJ6_GOSBA|nr:hypothetical protein ES319_D02G164400v1 [Gossypium barbadense]KAG4158866.1 hypothetical protein ERO13_D02G143333v2 [Gossypium hirsutum]TYI93942.1 hypothetical protein E1A91_D02G170300v1 [Gossypium mustelinum]
MSCEVVERVIYKRFANEMASRLLARNSCIFESPIQLISLSKGNKDFTSTNSSNLYVPFYSLLCSLFQFITSFLQLCYILLPSPDNQTFYC